MFALAASTLSADARRDGAPVALRVLAAVSALLVAASCFAGPGLHAHSAHYELSLHPSSRDGDITAIRGRMASRFTASCDGWRIEQSLAFRLLTMDGTRLEHLAHFDAFEEHDGSALTFNARTWEDRELVEELSGVARRRADGLVEVKYAQPQARIDTLPAGTLFPSAHVHAVLAAARAGTRVAMHTVFDGSSEENPFQISSVIGAPSAPGQQLPPALAGQRSWPVRLAYYPMDAVEPEADFEMSVTLFANGVAGDMVYDYGGFAIDVKLREVELLDMPRCD